jgi:hypothetical protein
MSGAAALVFIYQFEEIKENFTLYQRVSRISVPIPDCVKISRSRV